MGTLCENDEEARRGNRLLEIGEEKEELGNSMIREMQTEQKWKKKIGWNLMKKLCSRMTSLITRKLC
jgi:hypothetical protein